MTDARLGREGVVVPVSASDPAARLGREGVIVAHSFPDDQVTMRLGRLGIYVAIHREAPGWDIVKRDRAH